MFGASFLILLTEPVYRSLLVKRREDISSPGRWTLDAVSICDRTTDAVSAKGALS
jgi:hypothetical protein